jgi:predicted DNA-binding transcriptional regulator YafY
MTNNTNLAETKSAAADAALAMWLEMWNSDSEIARRICSNDFRIHFLISQTDGSNPMFVINAQSPSEAAISLIPEAIAARRVVRLDYTAEDGEARTTRDVGWCRLREGIRGFQLDRIRQLEITEEIFPDRDPAVLDADLSRWRTRRLG